MNEYIMCDKRAVEQAVVDWAVAPAEVDPARGGGLGRYAPANMLNDIYTYTC